MIKVLYRNIFLLFLIIALPQNNYCLPPLAKKINNKILWASVAALGVILITFLIYKNSRKKRKNIDNAQREKNSRKLSVIDNNISIKLESVFIAIKAINKENLEEGFKFFLDFLFASAIPRNPHDKKTFPIINEIGICLKNTLSEDEYIKLIIFITEKNYDSHNAILDWTIKKNLPIFFKTIDQENNTVLHHILAKTPIFYGFVSVFDYLLKRIIKTDRLLLNTKNNNGETILFSLLQNE